MVQNKVSDPSPNSTSPNPGHALDYDLLLDCVHCGLCTSACPTYVETGDENESPRGRIYLMRAVTDGKLELNDRVRGHLELCLDCRACETACPSGVQYGKLIEPFRVAMDSGPTSRRETIGSTATYCLACSRTRRSCGGRLSPRGSHRKQGFSVCCRRRDSHICFRRNCGGW